MCSITASLVTSMSRPRLLRCPSATTARMRAFALQLPSAMNFVLIVGQCYWLPDCEIGSLLCRDHRHAHAMHVPCLVGFSMQVQLMDILEGLVVEGNPGFMAAAAHPVALWARAFKLAVLGLQKGRLSLDENRSLSCMHRCALKEEQYAAAFSRDPPALWLAHATSLARHDLYIANEL